MPGMLLGRQNTAVSVADEGVARLLLMTLGPGLDYAR